MVNDRVCLLRKRVALYASMDDIDSLSGACRRFEPGIDIDELGCEFLQGFVIILRALNELLQIRRYLWRMLCKTLEELVVRAFPP